MQNDDELLVDENNNNSKKNENQEQGLNNGKQSKRNDVKNNQNNIIFEDDDEAAKKKEKENPIINNEVDEVKDKKEDSLILQSQPDNDLLKANNVDKKPANAQSVADQLSEVSRASGLNLKAYFIEENKKEINDLQKGPMGYTHFEFNGNMKEFYSKVYRHVLESNLIARQLVDGAEREKLPTFEELSAKFESFMQATGEELVKRGHLDKYQPFGGLSASEIKDIENSCLLNRAKTDKEAMERYASKLGGKNFDELVENGYKNAQERIQKFYPDAYKKGDNKDLDKKFLSEAANLISGMNRIRNSEKIWKTYTPDFSAPKWNQPIHRHFISNAFKAVRRGIGIVFDCTVKFPVNNAINGIKYPFNKLANAISIAYQERKLSNLVVERGFTKTELKAAINQNEKSPLDVEKDVKAIQANFDNNKKKIEEYAKEQNKEEVKEKDVVANNEQKVKENDPNKVPLIINSLKENHIHDEMVPEIKDDKLVVTKEVKQNI